jgi:7,8-dihydro-6-hydroxymethylpterin-pyrophosphokinase
VIFIETSLSAYELLTTIQNIEQELDPQREIEVEKNLDI